MTMNRMIWFWIGALLPGNLWASWPENLSFLLKGQTAFSGQILLQKSVTDVKAGTPAQTRTFTLDAASGKGTAENGDIYTMSLWDEVSFGADFCAGAPALKDYFRFFVQNGNECAELKPDYAGKTPLVYQEIGWYPSGKMKFLQTKIRKDEWLYNELISISIWFSPTGMYASHVLETLSSVIFSGMSQTKVEGKILPNP